MTASARCAGGNACRQKPAQKAEDDLLRWHRKEIGWRALQHGHVSGRARHCRHDGRRGRAAADHDDGLVRVVEVRRPVLRVNELAGEPVHPREVRHIAFVLVVVARAGDQESSGITMLSACAFVVCHELPGAGTAVPVNRFDLLSESELFPDAELINGRVEVVANLVGAGEDLGPKPGPEIVGIAEHVRVGANPGIAKQVPGAADCLASFEDHDAPLREALRKARCDADTGDASADDQYVEVLRVHRSAPSSSDHGMSLCILCCVNGSLPQ